MKTNEEFKTGETESQCSAILAHMNQGKPITALEALELCGCLRLSACIHDLRHKFGVEIVATKITTTSGKHVAQYRLAV